MEELVQAINNLSKISTKDVLSLVINIISAVSTIIIAIVVYSQNKRFNKENEILQKKLNEVENKRILHNTILDIYHKFMQIELNMKRLKNDEILSSILINYEQIIICSQDIAKIGIDVDYALTKAKIFFDENELKKLMEIKNNYEKFERDIQNYFKFQRYQDYEKIMKKVCINNDIDISRNGIKYFSSNALAKGIMNPMLIPEESIPINYQLQNLFLIEMCTLKSNSGLNEITNILEKATNILNLFDDEFKQCFTKRLAEKYLNIE